FFSSRRRHTRFSRDWSSDVCSSDLISFGLINCKLLFAVEIKILAERFLLLLLSLKNGTPSTIYRGAFPSVRKLLRPLICISKPRSEERRVGKEFGNCEWQYY